MIDRCGKKRFFSEDGALNAMRVMLASAKRRGGDGLKLKSAYKCRLCKFWHLTSQKQTGKKR